MAPSNSLRGPRRQSRFYPFRRAVVGGLGVVLPPLLTVVILLWVAGTIQQYALEPVRSGARNLLAWYWADRDERLLSEAEVVADIEAKTVSGKRTSGQEERRPPDSITLPTGDIYERLESGIYVPWQVRRDVALDDPEHLLVTPPLEQPYQQHALRKQIYQRYAELTTLRPQTFLPLFLSVFVLLLYLLGKTLRAGVGRVFWNLFEWGIHRVPLVRNVYDSVKKVTDFMFNEPEIEYKRVVAVEYPRKGCWSLGFVTGESLQDIRNAAGEPVLSVMIPCSPMSVTGYTITVLKSLTVDLNLTIDQAFQFVISCGVVLPPDSPLTPRAGQHDFAAATPASLDG